MKQLVAIVAYYMFGYLIFGHCSMKQMYFQKFGLKKILASQYTCGFSFFIIPLMLIALGNDYIKNRISDFKSLKQRTKMAPLPIAIWSLGFNDWICIFAILLL